MAFVLDKENIKELILSGNIDDYPEGIIVPIDKPYTRLSARVSRTQAINSQSSHTLKYEENFNNYHQLQ